MLSQHAYAEVSTEQLARLIPQQPLTVLSGQIRHHVQYGYWNCPTADITLKLILASLRIGTPSITSDTWLATSQVELLDLWSTTLNRAHGLNLDSFDLFPARTPCRLAMILNAQLQLHPSR